MRARYLPAADRVDRDGEAVVLVGREVVRLSALATTLVDSCVEWTGAAELVDVLLAVFGPTPEGVDAVVATDVALRTLATQGLVELD
ncbi:hypothetical protein BJ986_002037 [Phycicoccus badiiscoriae]|uniref:Coenzyme PQQ synthesis protein D (PqqD) n=1 Tax=Pedococcus badiiscoriae TaxID=642776 RepID=A0A852WFK1_9MICO|nr:hypothetical protein [Pedococcus badiiscoriae]NYG07550.1 hypothetical protein [Pedococcus badiiscoriae]